MRDLSWRLATAETSLAHTHTFAKFIFTAFIFPPLVALSIMCPSHRATRFSEFIYLFFFTATYLLIQRFTFCRFANMFLSFFLQFYFAS